MQQHREPGAALLYPVDAAGEAFDFYLDWVRGVGDEMTSAYNITAFPPVEIVPEPLRGKSFVIIRGCHCGRPDEAAALIDLWRRWRPPAHDMFVAMPFRDVAAISNDPVDPLPAVTTGRWLARVDRTTADAMYEAVRHGAEPSPVLFAELRHAGGAIAREDPHASFAARAGQYMLEAVALTPTPDAARDAEDRFTALWHKLADHIAPLGGYLNFVAGQERVSQLHAAFDHDTLRRLAAIKRAVDPENLFAHGLPLDG